MGFTGSSLVKKKKINPTILKLVQPTELNYFF